MKYLKISFGIFLVLGASRFIPHPPNFTALIALSFYIPALLGIKFIVPVILSFVLTDVFIGFHTLILFTWGSVALISIVSQKFLNNLKKRIIGIFLSCLIFYIVTNFGVWTSGIYGHDFDGLLQCYILAIPFFGNTIISTFLYSSVIEGIYKINENKLNLIKKI